MALLRGDVERIEAVARLDPGRLHIRDLEDLAHDLGVALLGGDVQRRLAVLVLLGRHLGDQRPVEVREDPLGVGHAPGPRREVERRVAALPWAVPAPPLQGHDAPEALLLLHPPEALELLQRAQPDAGLPFHGRIRWEKASDCDASFLTNPETFASPIRDSSTTPQRLQLCLILQTKKKAICIYSRCYTVILTESMN